MTEDHEGGLSLLFNYPEINPFTLDPPLPNLTPEPVEGLEFDTPQLRESVRAVAIKKGANILSAMYGTNPLIIQDMSLYSISMPMPGYRRPPLLPEVELPVDIVFLAELNPTGNTPLFKVVINGKIMLLKVFPVRGDPLEGVDEDGIPLLYLRKVGKGREVDHMQLFTLESSAYAHLLHYGVCRKGVVPNCYGWSRLSRKHVKRIQELEGTSINSRRLIHELPPKCLLLEFIEDATKLSWQNVTEELADKVVRGMYEIHAAYVQHGDIHRRNILIRPDGRIVWIDFDSAATPFRRDFEKGASLLELENCWGYMYSGLLPNKRIGWNSPWH